MLIDVVSDTICPWCFIGKRRLERALEQRSDVDFEVRWRPFRLDPAIPTEGVDRKTYLKARFGDGPEVMKRADVIRALGENEGISFAFDRIVRMPNTTDSHRLIHWAGTAGVQDAVVEGLFTAYFEDGRDIGDASVLEWIAGQAGMDADLVRDHLGQDTDHDVIAREDDLARRMGIQGVPAIIFANKFLLSGAQDSRTILRAIEKVEDTQTDAPTDRIAYEP